MDCLSHTPTREHTTEEVEAILLDAYTRGFNRGHDKGYDRGFSDCFTAIRELLRRESVLAPEVSIA